MKGIPMKHIFTAAAFALISATSNASAASSVDLFEIQGYAPNADLSELSDHQVVLLLQIIHGTGGEGKKHQQVRGFLLQVNGESFLNRLFK